MSNKIGYKLVANATSTKDVAPYYGMPIPVGSLAYDNILNAMIDSGTLLTKATAKYFLDAFFETCADRIASDVVRISTGTVTVYPGIFGSFASEDAAFDPKKNTLEIAASLSQDLLDAVAALIPEWRGETSAADVRLDSEMDIATQAFKTIDGTATFRLCGRNLPVPDGEDESIALYTKDGLTKVTDIEVSSNDGGQQLTCAIKGDEDLPKGTYKLVLKTHGLDPTGPLATLSLTVVNVTAYATNWPKVTAVHQEGHDEGEVAKGTEFTVTGERLNGTTVSLTMNAIIGGKSQELTEDCTVVSQTDTTIVAKYEGDAVPSGEGQDYMTVAVGGVLPRTTYPVKYVG